MSIFFLRLWPFDSPEDVCINMSDTEAQVDTKKKSKGAPRRALAASTKKNRSARPYKRLESSVLEKRKADMSKRVGILRAKLCILDDRLEKLTEEELLRTNVDEGE